jgi:Na+/melibiose symporter-like transporter
MFKLTLVALTLSAAMAGPAAAYIGPGLGAGAIGVVLGVIGAIGLALFAIIYYPIKRMIRRKRVESGTHQQTPE